MAHRPTQDGDDHGGGPEPPMGEAPGPHVVGDTEDLVMDIVRHLRSVEISAPIRMGDVVVSDVLGTGADVIASRDLLPNR